MTKKFHLKTDASDELESRAMSAMRKEEEEEADGEAIFYFQRRNLACLNEEEYDNTYKFALI